MGHDVYICYDDKDQITADAICHVLEDNKIKCWLKTRDLGVSHMVEGIMDAINGAQVMVLIFSSHSKHSNFVNTEVDIAFTENIPILVFKIDESKLDGGLEFFLNNKHWLDAYPNPEIKFESLIKDTSKLLGKPISKPVINNKKTLIDDEELEDKSSEPVNEFPSHFDALGVNFPKVEEDEPVDDITRPSDEDSIRRIVDPDEELFEHEVIIKDDDKPFENPMRRISDPDEELRESDDSVDEVSEEPVVGSDDSVDEVSEEPVVGSDDSVDEVSEEPVVGSDDSVDEVSEESVVGSDDSVDEELRESDVSVKDDSVDEVSEPFDGPVRRIVDPDEELRESDVSVKDDSVDEVSEESVVGSDDSIRRIVDPDDELHGIDKSVHDASEPFDGPIRRIVDPDEELNDAVEPVEEVSKPHDDHVKRISGPDDELLKSNKHVDEVSKRDVPFEKLSDDVDESLEELLKPDVPFRKVSESSAETEKIVEPVKEAPKPSKEVPKPSKEVPKTDKKTKIDKKKNVSKPPDESFISRFKIPIIIAVVALIAVGAFAFMSMGGNGGTGDIPNVALKITDFHADNVQNNGYTYSVVGSLSPQPTDAENYVLSSYFYDGSGNMVNSTQTPLKDAQNSGNGTLLGSISSNSKDIVRVEVKLTNKDNVIVSSAESELK